jgi:branched-chain amino acid transport system permease protein
MGAFYAHYTAFITPSATSIVRSLEYVMMAVIGGIGSLTGAIVGALIVTMLPQVLSGMERYETLLVGSILLGSILLLPAGIVPSLGKLRQRFIRSMDK